MSLIDLPALLMEASGNGADAAAGTAVLGVWAAVMGLFSIFYCLALIVSLVFFVVWIWMLIDCLSRKDYPGENDKLLWALVIVFAGIIGAGLYYFLVKKKSEEAQPPEKPEAQG
jgi:prolipoprotein diacylglyceryltransferase